MRTPRLAVALHLVVFGTCALIGSAAGAQYNWVGPDGSVHYGDLPPPPGAGRAALVSGAATAAAGASGPALPFALRTAASKFPVTLYTSTDCAPCRQGRDHLVSRGIPFEERTIGTQQDVDALRKLGFAGDGVPAFKVGGERAVGFDPQSWDRLLDAAGYPKTSLLPRGYRPSQARALAEPAVLAATAEPRPVASTADATDEQPTSADATVASASLPPAERRSPSARVLPNPQPRAPAIRF